MTRTIIDTDDELLERAKEILGTTTKKDTVNAALRQVVASRSGPPVPGGCQGRQVRRTCLTRCQGQRCGSGSPLPG